MTEVNKEIKAKPDVIFVSGGSSGADTSLILAGKAKGISVIGYIKNSSVPKDIRELYTTFSPAESHPQKDMFNVDLSHMLIAFRLNQPMTGKGTDQTINYALTRKYDFVEQKFDKEYVNKVKFMSGQIPVILIWDLSESNFLEFVKQTKEYVDKFKPKFVMVSGPTDETYKKYNVVNLVQKFFETLYK